MEILLELIFEIVGQFVLEFLADTAFRGVARVLANRIVRAVLGAALAVTVGLGGGYWWGERHAEAARAGLPASFWVSVSLGVVFVILAIVAARRPSQRYVGADTLAVRISDALAPWRWSVARLLGFALLNAALAAGIASGVSAR